MILYIDPVEKPTKVAIYSDEAELIESISLPTPNNQTDELLVEIDKLTKKYHQEINSIYVNISCGSYTSIRVGITVANFLGFSSNLQPIGVHSHSEIEPVKNRVPFEREILPQYKHDPVITKKQ